MAVIPLMLICTAAVTLSLYGRERHPLLQRPLWRYLACSAFGLLWIGGMIFIALVSRNMGALPLLTAYIFLPPACAIPFFWTTLGIVAEHLRQVATSETNLKMPRSYDRAEAAELEKRLDDALDLYLHAYDADDPVPIIRAADLLDRLGRPVEAVEQLRKALPLIEDEEKRALQAVRAAELIGEVLGSPPEARKLLEEVRAGIEDENIQARLFQRIQI